MEHREAMANHSSDLKEWNHILDTLEWYGREGMSSDESEVEEIYHPKLLPWCQ